MNPIPGDAALRRAEWAGVAAAIAAAALLVSRSWPGGPPALAAAPLLLCLLLWIAAVDARRWIIPDGAVLAVAVLGMGWRLGAAGGSAGGVLAEAVLAAADGLLWGAAFLLVRELHFRRRGFDGLGLGDVKLAFACGILNGTAGFAWALLLASLGGLAVALAAAMWGRRLEKLPFGAFLAPASGVIWIAGWLG